MNLLSDRRTGRTTRMLEEVAEHATQNKHVCVIVANYKSVKSFEQNPLIAQFVENGLVEIIPPKQTAICGKSFDSIFIDHYVAESMLPVDFYQFYQEIAHRARSIA